jgi:hypothetical protein
VEQPRDLPLELLIGLREEMAELRATVTHLAADLADLRQETRADIRRLDGRVFQLMLVQLATLATALGSLVTVLVS